MNSISSSLLFLENEKSENSVNFCDTFIKICLLENHLVEPPFPSNILRIKEDLKNSP